MTDHAEPTPRRQPPSDTDPPPTVGAAPRRSASETLARALGTAGTLPATEHVRAGADDAAH